MFSFKNLSNKKNLIAFIVSAVGFVYAIVSLFLMSSNSFYISYDSSLLIRYVLVYVVNIIFALGCLRFALGAIQTKKQNSAMPQGFLFFMAGEACIIGIAVLTLIQDYSIGLRLIEDAIFVVYALAVLFMCIFGMTIKDKKKLFIISMVIVGVSLLLSILDLAIFALSDFSVAGVDESRTLRDVDFSYVFASLGLMVPFIVSGIYALMVFQTETESEKEE